MAIEPANKGKRYLEEALSVGEAVRVLKVINTRYRTGKRNRAHLALLWRCGLRPGESCSIQLGDLRLEDQPATLWVMKPKGYQRERNPAPPRQVGIDKRTVDELRKWIAVRGDAPGPLFTTSKGAPVDTSYLRKLLPRLARRAGIERRVHPHGLRHTCAHNMQDAGIPLRHIRDHLGHANIATTDAYLRGSKQAAIEANAAREDY